MRRSRVLVSIVSLALVGAAMALAKPPDRLSPTTSPAIAPRSGTGTPAIAPVSSERCGMCHPLERLQLDRSPHARAGVRCVSCHGGNETSFEQQVAHRGNFVGRPKVTDIPRLCASCHASEEKMRPYHLPTDQFALYQTSGHGRRLAAGDTRAAMCSDCHGSHEILSSRDTTSRVFPLNIAKTCGSCHGDSALMVRDRHRPDAYREYLSSAHGLELSRGNLRAPTCVSCHGVHGAGPPEARGIDQACARCHAIERRYLTAGPHQKTMAAAGLAECASCHGQHESQPAEPKQLSMMCASCHGGDSGQAAAGVRMWTDYQAAATQLDQAASLVAEADALPVATDDYRARLEAGRTRLREALPAAHSVDERAFAGLTARAGLVGAEVASEIRGQLGRARARKVWLLVFWVLIVLTVLVIRRIQSQAGRRD